MNNISYDEWLFGPSPLSDPKRLAQRLSDALGLDPDQALEQGANSAVEGSDKVSVRSSAWRKIS